MLDVLLIPAALLLVLALQAVRRGDHRLHGHLMLAAFTVIGLRLVLHPRALLPTHLGLWLAVLAAAGTTLLLGRMALAWREARSTHAAFPRIHRAFGTLTLLALALTTVVWLLRNRG
ncbi:hypothetical protein [Geothrix sp. PMB-07]|uniref:hypothetical protein n=1 Tax=Geothrix sp. PMB-07 TaxID=3068640 RepID=UPI002741AF25|nr:hypothetical protein [Geothrix sp. PMB-07]WLT33088.1 hypothetical protein Q9293_07100 [Geothrix sp. PMB-07]